MRPRRPRNRRPTRANGSASPTTSGGVCPPQVFDSEQRPWVRPDGAEPERATEVIRRCPAGALRYRLAEVPPRSRTGRRPSYASPPAGSCCAQGDQGHALRLWSER
ncbi:(4Fe-4S)-binding protein [Streptomyces sp. NPDC059874]|uniref:(4Fe-4S)-binding protein n=1 Tax=Streptomyces sp. NPDC059874 TaxID=3346983 RepID=UPI003664A12F